MASKRMIHYELWEDEDFGSLSPNAKILFIGCISQADDEGRLKANDNYLRGRIFMYNDISLKKISELLDEINDKLSNFTLYKVDGKKYIQFDKWTKYQKLRPERITSSEIPLPSDADKCRTDVGQVSADCPHSSSSSSSISSSVSTRVEGCMTAAEFDEFWILYPRKDGKKPSWDKFKKLKSNLLPTILAAVKRQSLNPDWVGTFIPMPLTWINQERWNDEAKGAEIIEVAIIK